MKNTKATTQVIQLAIGLILLAGAPSLALPDELIPNGSFELGNAHFTSHYPISPGWIWNAGVYDIVADPSLSHPSATSFGDHTTGNGLMMAVNGGLNSTMIVWSQTIPVTPHSHYRFTAWISSWTEGSPAGLQFLFNGAPVGFMDAPEATGTWVPFETEWNSGEAMVLEIGIVDLNIAFGGNDFALDDLSLTTREQTPLPQCGTELLVEDFESCPAGTWIGACNNWQTYANANDGSDFYVTDADQASGLHSLHVAGSGTCWEGAAYKYLTGPRHILVQAMMKASGDGPLGCHGYQNGLDSYPAVWSFEMGNGTEQWQGGLVCAVAGGGYSVVVPGFADASGRWYAVATELDYDMGRARFWLDGTEIWTTPFDTTQAFYRVWMRSGEGQGWFDDVRVCSLAGVSAVGEPGESPKAPVAGVLSGNYPNPFNPLTSIRFALPSADHVELAVYDARGRLVRRLLDESLDSGEHAVNWNGRDDSGRSLPAGVYFARLKTGRAIESKPMNLLR